MTTATLALEHIKDIDVHGSAFTVVQAYVAPNLWVDRRTVIKLQLRRRRELEALRRDCARLRGLLRDLD
jgi:hypothetical protein